MDPSDIVVRWTKGQGPGGQHKNKVENCCVMTHTPTGLSVTVDGRSRRSNEKEARRLLARKIQDAKDAIIAADRKARREHAIRNEERIRTYDYSRGVVTDHRTGKTASIKDVLGKGLLGKLR